MIYTAYITKRYIRLLKIAKSLYHGTIIDNLKNIKELVLLPSAGNFVEEFYGGEVEEDTEIPELLFAADKKHWTKQSQLCCSILKKLHKWISEVREEEIKARGLLVIIRGDSSTGEHDLSFKQHKKDDNSWEKRPIIVKPDNYYGENTI